MNPMSATPYDVIVIGAGPIGLACGIAAKKSGLRYLILEKGNLVNSLYHFPREMTFFSTSNLLEIGEVPFVSIRDKPTRAESLEYYRRVVDHYGLQIHYYEKVINVVRHSSVNDDFQYLVSTSKNREYLTKHVVIATGFYDHPRMLGVPGEDLSHVSHYYTDVHPYIGHKVLVVGGANSACDVALELFHKGCEVTMVVRGPELYPKVKYWIRPNIENRIKEGSIHALFESEVVSIEEKSVTVLTSTGIQKLEADFVLAMTGYQPDFSFFQRIGLQLDSDDPKLVEIDPSNMMTSLPGIYMAGVAAAGMYTSKYFIENTRHHADLIIDHIVSGRRE